MPFLPDDCHSYLAHKVCCYFGPPRPNQTRFTNLPHDVVIQTLKSSKLIACHEFLTHLHDVASRWNIRETVAIKSRMQNLESNRVAVGLVGNRLKKCP